MPPSVHDMDEKAFFISFSFIAVETWKLEYRKLQNTNCKSPGLKCISEDGFHKSDQPAYKRVRNASYIGSLEGVLKVMHK